MVQAQIQAEVASEGRAAEAMAVPVGASQAWITRLAVPVASTSIAAQRGALAGLTFAAKDNIDLAGVPTTAACPPFAYTPPDHATVVRRLLDAGAACLGKTNLDQFACGLNGTRSPYGAVPNAFNAQYISGGSSSGSAYVVATGQVDFALGTDTAGSGRVPAGLNNIVGLKPSRGLVSARGVVPAAQSVDCVSIFARTVARAAQVLRAAMGHDPADPYSRALQLAPCAWGGDFRFGVPAQLEFFGDAQSQAAFGAAVTRMRELGGSPVSIDYTPLAQAAAMLYDSALVAERYAAIRSFFDAHPEAVTQPVRAIIDAGRRYSAADWCDAQAKLRAFAQQAAPMWDAIDVLLLPTAPTHYTIAQMQADPVELNRRLGTYTNFVNLLDCAALSVPAGMRPDGLPFGITLVGPCASDWQLCELGQRFHHAGANAQGGAITTQGATGVPLPAPQAIPGLHATEAGKVQLAVVGAHLSGLPLNGQLTERGARLLRKTRTAADYRLFALPGTTPPKPGLLRVETGEGTPIEVEVWEMPTVHYGSFVALVPAPLGIGTLKLEDGASVQGFVCEALATQRAADISRHGGWRNYLASLQQQQQQ